MRIGLIAAIRRTAEGTLRGDLVLAGRSVLGWQITLLQALGAERIVCLTDAAIGETLQMQLMVEARGASFHAINGFAALPALVRADDELIILRDGLVPDPAIVQTVFGRKGGGRNAVAAIPGDHPLATAFPDDFERIDAERHWAGLLSMRGAAVQQLADFPSDSDPVSLLLRLALQAGTPCYDLNAHDLAPERWLLADDAAAVVTAEQALIASAAAVQDWLAPLSRLAAMLVRALAPRGLAQGGPVASVLALILVLAGVVVAGSGFSAAGLMMAATGSFAARVAAGYRTMRVRLRREGDVARGNAVLSAVVDGSAAVTAFLALAPWSQWEPLAALGPVVIGLARLVSRKSGSALAMTASDQTALLLVLTVASSFGVLPEIFACLALGLLAALLLHADED